MANIIIIVALLCGLIAFIYLATKGKNNGTPQTENGKTKTETTGNPAENQKALIDALTPSTTVSPITAPKIDTTKPATGSILSPQDIKSLGGSGK